MTTISACIITKNESKNIERCLRSVQYFCDEIIVLDTGSEDDTVRIAQRLDAKIYLFDWDDDFSAARNECIKYASGDFTLILDADEVLVPKNFSKELLTGTSQSTGGFILDVISYSNAHGYEAKYISPQLRIFRNRCGFKFTGRIHEQISTSITNNGYKIAKLDWSIIHHGYNLSQNDMRSKHLRNMRILEKESLDTNDPLLHFHKARTYYALDMLEHAIDEINYAMQKIESNHIASSSILSFAAKIFYQSKNFRKAKDLASQAYLSNKTLCEPLYILSEICIKDKDYLNVLECYKILRDNLGKTSLNLSWGDTMIPFQHFEPKFIYSLYKTGNKYKAAELLNQILVKNPNRLDANLVKLSILMQENNLTGFRKLLSKLVQIYPNNNKIHKLKQKYLSDDISISYFRPRISLSMIVRNEERMLPDCLDSAKKFVYEIVIVDTGSTDKTVEIAESFGAKIFLYNWNDDFSDARNYSLNKCSGDWILYMDADERLVLPNEYYLYNLLIEEDENICAYLCTINSPHRKDDGSVETHQTLYPRLFRNYGYPEIHFTGKIHEQITPAFKKLGKQIVPSEIKIEHLGYNLDLPQMHEKINRNYNLLMKQIEDDPTNGYIWFQLGQTLARLKLVEQSIHALEFALQTGNLSESIKASTYSTLSQLKGNQKDFAKALHYAEKSLKIVPEQRYARNLKGYSLLYLGRFEEAEAEFNRLLQNISADAMVAFDIEVPKNIVDQGLIMAHSRRIN